MARNAPTIGLAVRLLSTAMVLAVPSASASSQPSQQQQNALRSNCRSDFMAHCTNVRPGGAEALQCLQRNVAKLSPGCQSAVNALNPPSARPQQAAPAAAPAPPPAAAAAAPPAPAAAPTAPPAPAATASPARKPPARSAATPPMRTTTAPAAGEPAAKQQVAIRQSCQSDFLVHCRGVQPGGSQALQCLQRNAVRLSVGCRRALAALVPTASAPALASAPASAPPAPTAQQQSAIKFTCRRDFMRHCRGVPQGGAEAFACLQRNAARLSPDCRTSLAAVADVTAGTPPAAAPPPAARPVGPFPLRRAIRERIRERMLDR